MLFIKHKQKNKECWFQNCFTTVRRSRILGLVRYIFSSFVLLLFGFVSALLWAVNHTPEQFNSAKLPKICAIFIKEFQSNEQALAGCDVRRGYNQIVSFIPKVDSQLVDQGTSIANRALCAYQIRHEARIHSRSQMDNLVSLGLIRLFDFVRYGKLDGPSFENLRQDKALSYTDIIQSASKTNKDINGLCEIR